MSDVRRLVPVRAVIVGVLAVTLCAFPACSEDKDESKADADAGADALPQGSGGNQGSVGGMGGNPNAPGTGGTAATGGIGGKAAACKVPCLKVIADCVPSVMGCVTERESGSFSMRTCFSNGTKEIYTASTLSVPYSTTVYRLADGKICMTLKQTTTEDTYSTPAGILGIGTYQANDVSFVCSSDPGTTYNLSQVRTCFDSSIDYEDKCAKGICSP